MRPSSITTTRSARADRVIVIDDGKLLMDGTPAEVFARADELTAVGLDVPQCTALVHALREAGVEINGEPVTTEECAEMICRAWEEKHGNRNA